MKFLLLGLWLTLGPRLCAAQRPSIDRFTVTQYTDENGLPQNSVKGIAPDGMGFIWMATENGLVRFDGQHLYTFTKANSTLLDNRFVYLHPSLMNGTQYIAGRPASRLYGVDPAGNFIRLENGKAMRDSLYWADIKRLLPFRQETTGYGLANLLSVGLPTNLGPYRPKNLVQVVGKTGCFYVCYHHQVVYYDNWKKRYTVPFRIDQFWNVFAIGDYLYCFQADGSLVRICQNGPIPVRLTGALTQPDNFAQLKTRQLYWNHVADQVFLWQEKKLYRLKPDATGQMTTQLLLEAFDLDEHQIRTVYQDSNSQRLFLGSLTKGLFVLTHQPFETLLADGPPSDNNFYGQTPYDSNTVINPIGILLGKDGHTGKRLYKRLPAMAIPPRADGYSDNYNLFIDSTDCIWVRREWGMIRFSPKGKELERTWGLNEEVKKIYPSPNGGLIWIGVTKKGFYQLNPSDSVPRRLIGRPLEDIYCFGYGSADKLLIGTEHGLYQFNVRSHQLQFINGTKGLFIRSIYQARPGETWFTTYGDGVFLLLHNQLVPLPLDDNQYLATSHHIFEDRKGFFWIPTNKGLFQAARSDLLAYARGKLKGQPTERPFYLYYTKEQGFLTNEFNGGGEPGIVRLANGYVSIPSLRGLVWFKPELLRPVLPDGPLLIDRIEVGQRPYPSQGDTLQFPSEPQQIRFQLITPYFGNSHNLRLAYQLLAGQAAPEPDGWIPISAQEPSILISSLQRGNYRLLIRKINGFGENNYTYKQLTVIVPPLWYETWWMRLLLIALALGSLYALARVRFRQILRSNQRLETLVTQRTSQLRASEEALSRQLYVQSRLIASITHDIQSPLQFVTEVSKRMSHLLSTKNFDALYKTMDTISTTTERTNRLLKELLVYTKMKVYERPRELDWVDLHELIASKQEVFTSLMNQKQNVFVNDVPLGLLVGSDAHLLGIILHNLLDNAVKYTIRGQIRFSASQQDGTVQLILANTGLGIPDQTVDWLNQPQDTDSTASDTQQGIGLLMVKELAALIGVGLSVKQTEITCFYLKFQAGQSTS